MPTSEKIAEPINPAEPEAQDELLRPGEVCSILKISRTTLWRWASDGILSPVRISSKTTRYRRSEVDDLLAKAS